MTYALCGATVFDGDQFLKDHCVIVKDKEIIEVVSSADLPANLTKITLADGILAPGFIDLQVNGGGGVMLNNARGKEGVDTMTAAHRHTGTTSMLPTLTSDTPDRQHACVTAVEAAKAAGNFGVLGVHIEGPFFEPNKRGAHKASMIRPPQPEDIDWLCSLELSSIIVTLAPEHTQPGQIRRLTEAGIRVCAGHTNASYTQIQNAINEGLCGFTHLFNAMSPLTSREPGVVGAALDNGDTWVGIIADGHHVHPACIRVAHSAKPEGKTLLVTDAMSTVGSTDNFFEMYGEKIEERDGRLINAEGVLAGSAIGMIDAVRVATDVAGIPLRESLRMAALYPAQFLRRENELGRLKKGFRADLVHFDDHYSVLGTWVAGHHRAHNGESSLPTRRNPS